MYAQGRCSMFKPMESGDCEPRTSTNVAGLPSLFKDNGIQHEEAF